MHRNRDITYSVLHSPCETFLLPSSKLVPVMILSFSQHRLASALGVLSNTWLPCGSACCNENISPNSSSWTSRFGFCPADFDFGYLSASPSSTFQCLPFQSFDILQGFH